MSSCSFKCLRYIVYSDVKWVTCVTNVKPICARVCLHVLCRSSERRSPSCLLGAWPGHPVLPQLPTRLHCQAVQAPLPRLRPRSVWRLLPGAPAGSITGLGPPRARVHKLQPETRRTLTGDCLPSSEHGREPLAHSARSLSLLYLCYSNGSVLYLWKGSF